MAKPKPRPKKRKSTKQSSVSESQERLESGVNESAPSKSTTGESSEQHTAPLTPVKPQKTFFLIALLFFVGWLLYLVYVAFKVSTS